MSLAGDQPEMIVSIMGTALYKNHPRFGARHEKTGFCICESKDADQLSGNREADQRICFR